MIGSLTYVPLDRVDTVDNPVHSVLMCTASVLLLLNLKKHTGHTQSVEECVSSGTQGLYPTQAPVHTVDEA
jgi:hypothetical protein